MQCPRCFRDFAPAPWVGDDAVACPECHAAAVAAIRARDNLPVGGESSPAEETIEPTPTCGGGAYTGRGQTAGGGNRVIRKAEGLGG